MSYNSNLQSTNNKLQEIYTTIKVLPKNSNTEINLQEKTVVPTNKGQVITPDSGYDGLNKVTVEGDSNLVSENIKNGVNIFGVNGICKPADSSVEESLLNKTISGTYTNAEVKNIRNYAFCDCFSLTSVSFPECTTIGKAAFDRCSNLIFVNFPKCTRIEGGAFFACPSLTSASFPACTNIAPSAFWGCTNLSYANFPKCAAIAIYAFYECSNLTSANFPECTNIGGDAFYKCSSLTSVSFPVCTRIEGGAFYECSSLTSISFPKCSYISYDAFAWCYNLSQVYLMNSSICTLSNSDAFYSTPFTGYSSYFSGTPSIYVPTSLVDAYKSATNWAYFSSYISGYSELPLEPETISIGVTIDGEYVEFVSPSGYPTITVEATNEPVYCDFVLGELYNITLYGTDIAG